MNYRELIDALRAQHIAPIHLATCTLDEQIPGIGQWRAVQQYGGWEDGDGAYGSIVHFIDAGVYVRTTGRYSSYAGIEVSESFEQACVEARPKQITTIIYESVY